MHRLGVRPSRPVLPPRLARASATGFGIGALGAGTAFALHTRAQGPTWIAVSLLLASLVTAGALCLVLARRRRARESNWLALGYTLACSRLPS